VYGFVTKERSMWNVVSYSSLSIIALAYIMKSLCYPLVLLGFSVQKYKTTSHTTNGEIK